MASPDTEATINNDDEDEDEGGLGDIFDDIFVEEDTEGSERLKAFSDLEQLTMIEVAAETEAVLEELKIRQGG